MANSTSTVTMHEIVALCKRRGFIFQASDIYGGINGFWDYGPLGIALKNNIRDSWWRTMVLCPPLDQQGDPLRIFGLDSAIIQHPTVWQASGHLTSFADPMVDCRSTKNRYRADHIVVYLPNDTNGFALAFTEDQDEVKIISKIKQLTNNSNASLGDWRKTMLTDLDPNYYHRIIAPDTTEIGTLTEPKAFNLMFATQVGAVVDDSTTAYLRPETAQGIFINYKNILDSTRSKLPFGVAQIGKAFRNEVTPRNFIFRSREFEQMELEWFCHADEATLWQEYWLNQRCHWWHSLGLTKDCLHLRKHSNDELAHYAKSGNGTIDIEYQFPFSGTGFSELEGIAHRCDFDLLQHQEFSGIKQEYIDQLTGSRYIPHVIEPSAGLTRALLAVLCNSYQLDSNRPNGMFLNFPAHIAPIKAAVLPLQGKGELLALAKRIFNELREHYVVTLEEKQSIGKRYAKNDEIGTPYCITIDFDSISNNDVTIRDRNTTQQIRISIDALSSYLQQAIGNAKKSCFQ